MPRLIIACLGYTRLEVTEILNSNSILLYGKLKLTLLRLAVKICACPPTKLTGLQENHMYLWEKVSFIFFHNTLLLAYAVFLTAHLTDGLEQYSSVIRPAFLGREVIMLLLKCLQ